MPIDDHPPQPATEKPAHWWQLTPKHSLIMAVLFFVVMVLVGTIPGYAKALSDATDDKLLHFCAYGVMSWLIFNGVRGVMLSRALRTLLLLAALGALDETIQSFIPYRTASVLDWYADMLAGLICVTVLVLHTLVRIVAAKNAG